jgi:serine protease inhibitor
VLEVDEEGSRAAAATAIVMGRGSRKRPLVERQKQFYAEHPFLVFILDVRHNVLLFSGCVNTLPDGVSS